MKRGAVEEPNIHLDYISLFGYVQVFKVTAHTWAIIFSKK